DGTSEDGMPNVRGLLAFGLRKQIALAPDAITMAFLELRLADLLEDSIDKREIADALKLYRGALARDPESPTAVAGVRRVGALLGDLGAQLAAERAGADIALDRQAKVAHLLRAAELSRRVPAPDGGDEVAIELVVRALREDPDSAEAAAAASALFLGRGDARRLVDVLMEAAGTAKRPDRIVALAREGAHHASTSLDNVPVAIALLTQAREADPHDATLLTELGDLYVQQRAWSEAASSYSESVKNAQNAPTVAIRAHRALAQLYEGPLEDPKAALAELRLVCKLAPDDVDAQRRLAGVLEAQGDRDGALRALEALVASPNLSARERIDCFSRISDIKAARAICVAQSTRCAWASCSTPIPRTSRSRASRRSTHGTEATRLWPVRWSSWSRKNRPIRAGCASSARSRCTASGSRPRASLTSVRRCRSPPMRRARAIRVPTSVRRSSRSRKVSSPWAHTTTRCAPHARSSHAIRPAQARSRRPVVRSPRSVDATKRWSAKRCARTSATKETRRPIARVASIPRRRAPKPSKTWRSTRT
ncbi:MAG: tetratricopeptide repeat protein, partial [Polyangiales bacterium]